MSDDLDQDVIPVKETAEVSKKTFEIKDDVQHRRMVFKLPRHDLEDKFLRLCEEHLLLKRHACKQEDKIKKMATKLVRLINDHKKQDQGGGGGKRRDIETEDLIEEMQSKIRELDKQNTLLKEKLVAKTQQLAMHTKHTKLFTHTHGHSRPNTGVSRTSGARYGGNSEGAYSPPIDYRETSSQGEGYRDPTPFKNRIHPDISQPHQKDDDMHQFGGKNSHSPTHHWEEHEHNIEDIITALKEQAEVLEQENTSLKKTIKENEQKHDEIVISLKSQVNQNQKQAVYENIEIIKLQRETKQAQDKMTSLLDQYNKLQENYMSMKGNQERLLREIENLTYKLKEEQHHSLMLQRDAKDNSLNSLIVTELREQTSVLQKEISILKESNLKLINSAISIEKDRQHHDAEMNLKVQVMKLEEILKSNTEEKNNALNKFFKKSEEYNDLEHKLKTIQADYENVQSQYNAFKAKMAAFSEVEDADSLTASDVHEALALLRNKREQPDEHLEEALQEPREEFKTQFSQLELDHAETVAELLKARTMLEVQFKISNDYKSEIDILKQRSHQLQEETQASLQEKDTRLQEKDHLLEIRGAHIQRLEQQLADVAFGTKSVKFDKTLLKVKDEISSSGDSSAPPGGENTFEIHIKKVILTSEGEKLLENENPSTFLTWNFYDFELMSSPVVKGKNPVFACSAQYNVLVDMVFLQYLNKEPMTVEYHEVIEMEYFTIATAQVRLRELLDLSGGKLHASIPLISENNTVVGNVEYWVSLKYPLTKSFNFSREKSKALSYVSANETLTKEALSLLEEKTASEPRRNFNVLGVKIIRCSGLHSRNNKSQPSPYCTYKFFNWPDHNTIVIKSSNDPLFNDHKIYRLNMNDEMEKYLQNENMEVYVYDDDSPDDNEFLGRAIIPLNPLLKNSTISGKFQLYQADGTFSGIIEVAIKWHIPYSSIKQAPISKDELTVQDERLTSGKEPLNISSIKNNESSKSNSAYRPDRTETVEQESHESKDISHFPSPLLTSTPSQSNVKSKPPVAPRIKSNQERQKSVAAADENKSFLKEQPLLKALKENNFDDDSTTSESEEKDQDPQDDDIAKEGNSQSSSSSQSSEDDSDKNSYTIVIEVGSLTLYPGSSVMLNEKMHMLFVAYEFLNYPAEELEAPVAQSKTLQPMMFNFKKEFRLSPVEDSVRNQLLKQALLSSSSADTRITFSIVSEPSGDEDDDECEDTGHAYFDLKEVIEKERDFINHPLHVFDSSNPAVVIGSLTVTIKALDAVFSVLS